MENRIIKFRAFDVVDEKMTIEPYRFEPDENKTTGLYRFYTDWRDEEDGRGCTGYIMQFTGLLDKNGKEIYEGDIVRVWLNGWGKTKDEYKGRIIFKLGSFMIDEMYDIVYKEPKYQYLPHNSMLLSQYELFEQIKTDYIPNYGEVTTVFSENAMFVEVIGNIYESNLL